MASWHKPVAVALLLFSLGGFTSKISAQVGPVASRPVALPLLAQPDSKVFPVLNECLLLSKTLCAGLPEDQSPSSATERDDTEPGALHRGLHRFLRDEADVLQAPFKRSSLGWDAAVLLGTGALIATDRQTIGWTSKSNEQVSGNISNAAIYGTGAAAGAIWVSGLITHDAHQNETGQLTLEALVDALPIYTVMQVIAGRERPDAAAGHGRFLQDHWIDGSFPGGHAMFAWTMASVVAHEYPRWWVKALFYGAATTVSVTRFTGRDHFASDIAVGAVFGYLIGRHVFHAHCNPEFSEACH